MRAACGRSQLPANRTRSPAPYPALPLPSPYPALQVRLGTSHYFSHVQMEDFLEALVPKVRPQVVCLCWGRRRRLGGARRQQPARRRRRPGPSPTPPPCRPQPQPQVVKKPSALDKFRRQYVPPGVPPAQPPGAPLVVNRIYKHLGQLLGDEHALVSDVGGCGPLGGRRGKLAGACKRQFAAALARWRAGTAAPQSLAAPPLRFRPSPPRLPPLQATACS